MRLTEFHCGYRAYSVESLKRIVMDRMTDDFHFDTEIIIRFRHQGFHIVEVPIPAYYGIEFCYVDGMKCARNAAGAARRYRGCVRAIRSCSEFEEYWRNFPLKEARHFSHSLVQGVDRRILDRTNVRLYVRRTSRQLLDENGFEVTARMMSVMPVELVLGLAPRSRLMRAFPALLAAATRLLLGLLGYQTLYTARHRRA